MPRGGVIRDFLILFSSTGSGARAHSCRLHMGVRQRLVHSAVHPHRDRTSDVLRHHVHLAAWRAAKDVVFNGRPARQLAGDGDHRVGLVKIVADGALPVVVCAAPTIVRLWVQRVHGLPTAVAAQGSGAAQLRKGQAQEREHSIYHIGISHALPPGGDGVQPAQAPALVGNEVGLRADGGAAFRQGGRGARAGVRGAEGGG